MPPLADAAHGVFGPGDLDDFAMFFGVHGYATLRGAVDDDELERRFTAPESEFGTQPPSWTTPRP